MNMQHSQTFTAPPHFFLLPVGEVENFINKVNNCDDLRMMGIRAYNNSYGLKKNQNASPSSSSSTTNTNPYSNVIGTINLVVCEKIIFKRVNENVTKEYRNMKRGHLPPLSAAEKAAGPPAPIIGHRTVGGRSYPVTTNQAEIDEYNNRLRRTPLTDSERQTGPPSGVRIEARDIWDERLSITPTDPNNPLDAEPEYGASDRQIWREREQVRRNDEDTYGHWWVEVYTSSTAYSTTTLENSYGWWPSVQLGGAWDTVKGVPGLLNYYLGANLQDIDFDPHSNKSEIDWLVDEAFHPVVINSSEDALITALKTFATSYDNTPRTWAFPAGPTPGRSNCQKFQEEMIDHLVAEHKMSYKKNPIDRSKVPNLNTATKQPTTK